MDALDNGKACCICTPVPSINFHEQIITATVSMVGALYTGAAISAIREQTYRTELTVITQDIVSLTWLTAKGY
jgi:hypothetical protein